MSQHALVCIYMKETLEVNFQIVRKVSECPDEWQTMIVHTQCAATVLLASAGFKIEKWTS